MEPEFSLYGGLLSRDNLTQVLIELEEIARPLVGLRSKDNEDWWSYPMVVVYLPIDITREGRNGNYY